MHRICGGGSVAMPSDRASAQLAGIWFLAHKSAAPKPEPIFVTAHSTTTCCQQAHRILEPPQPDPSPPPTVLRFTSACSPSCGSVGRFTYMQPAAPVQVAVAAIVDAQPKRAGEYAPLSLSVKHICFDHAVKRICCEFAVLNTYVVIMLPSCYSHRLSFQWFSISTD